MVLSYTFLDRSTSNVEVDEQYVAFACEYDRKERNASRKHRRYCYSYDAILYEGEEYADENTPQSYMEREELAAKLHKAISSLTDTQKRRIMMLVNGLSINEIARIEGIAPNAAWKSIDSARSKIKEAIN